MVDAKFYRGSTWLEGTWSDDWVRDLPDRYWADMLAHVLRDFATWVPQERWPEYLASDAGQGQVREQLFVRLSQASANFVPWLSEYRALAGRRVLEIGCGTGSSTAALARAGALVTGLDIAEQYLRINRARLDALGLTADLRCVPSDWLASSRSAEPHVTPADGHPPYDIVVCYALLEHLLPLERLALLGALRLGLAATPGCWLVIYETPNRFAPIDWHSTHTGFPDVLPDELAQAYLTKRLAPGHPWRKAVSQYLTEHGREGWFRGGRGVSFHEFDIALGMENIDIVQDGYSNRCDYMRNFHPNEAYEAALATVFAGFDPPVPRGFCRPTLDLVLQWRTGADRVAAAGSDAMPDAKSAFGEFYQLGWWGSAESKSGRGSELAATAVFRTEFECWLDKHPEIASVLDAPCGDFNWMRAMRWPRPIRYIGGDVVAELVAENAVRYGGLDRVFLELDIIGQNIPGADLWLCRDAMIHFPFALGAAVVRKFLESDISYFLATTFPADANTQDCVLGGYHKINLVLAPFDLGEPETLLRDPAENNQVDRFIGVWPNPRRKKSGETDAGT